MNFESFERSVTIKTKAVLLSHTFGILEDERIIARSHQLGIIVIDDVAQAFYHKVANKLMGNLGDIAILSFGNTKNTPAYGGGALLYNRDELSVIPTTKSAQRSIEYFLHNIYRPATSKKKNVAKMKRDKLDTFPIHVEKVQMKKMSSLNASIVLSQLDHLSEIRCQTYKNYRYLSAAVSKIKNVQQITDDYSDGFVSYFTIIVPSNRFLFSKGLAGQGIQSTWNYYPVHKIPCYKQYCKSYCPSLENCESLWQNVISLPFKYPLKEVDMDLVCQGIQEGTKKCNELARWNGSKS